MSTIQKRRQAGIITQHEDSIRAEILAGLIQDKGGEAQISTAMRVLAEIIASDVSLLISFNRSIDAVIKNNQKARENPKALAQLDGYKRPLVGSLSANLQRFGFDRITETAYVTGWRIADELLTRQRHHLDLKAGWLRLDAGETKNNEGRMFPLTPRLREVLEKQIAKTEAFQREKGIIVPWLFHRKGKPIKGFRKAWLTACKLAGVPGKIPHDFRRTAVRNLERAGVHRSAAMKMVGHKTEAIYRRYAVVGEGELKEAADKLAQLHLTDQTSKQKAGAK